MPPYWCTNSRRTQSSNKFEIILLQIQMNAKLAVKSKSKITLRQVHYVYTQNTWDWRFCVLWARIYRLKTHFDALINRMSIQFRVFFPDKKAKWVMTNVMLGILDGFFLVWALIYRHSKSCVFTSDSNFLNWGKWMLVVHILTQILVTLDFHCLTNFAKISSDGWVVSLWW